MRFWEVECKIEQNDARQGKNMQIYAKNSPKLCKNCPKPCTFPLTNHLFCFKKNGQRVKQAPFLHPIYLYYIISIVKGGGARKSTRKLHFRGSRMCPAPYMWGRRVALHPLKAPAKLKHGHKLIFAERGASPAQLRNLVGGGGWLAGGPKGGRVWPRPDF